ncbi:MAG TPA: DUF3572 domain-containing protein [Pseudorhodoplanes sp.]|nr:DUF3572 domain-containing protein [Pseudorhodoplanes sp.]
MLKRESKPNRREAEAVAIQALSFIAADSGRLGRFLASTGIGPQAIRQAARESGFLAGVLDYVVSDEQLLKSFAEEIQAAPRDIAAALTALAGPGWERDAP